MKTGEITVLVIEDEEDIRTLLLHNLRKDGYTAVGAPSGEHGLKMARGVKPHSTGFGLMLPGGAG